MADNPSVMRPRFYVPDLDPRAELAPGAVEHRDVVAGREPQHLREVARLVVGEPRRAGRHVDRVRQEPRNHGRRL